LQFGFDMNLVPQPAGIQVFHHYVADFKPGKEVTAMVAIERGWQNELQWATSLNRSEEKRMK
jgi:hypothetical protein